MWTRLGPGLAIGFLTLGVGAAVGCSIANSDADATENAVSNGSFNRNHLLDDAVLLDSKALTEDDIQRFLDKTPYGTESPLAEYKDSDGNTAAAILLKAATAAGINPIELLVRLQMEYALVGGPGSGSSPGTEAGASDAHGDQEVAPAATVDPMAAEKIEQAFNCGRKPGLAIQAACAAQNIARAMTVLRGGGQASGGWRVGVRRTTADKVSVTPDNAATAALYSYTPFVGERGGGAKGVAGASGHMLLWEAFAKALKYTGPSCVAADPDAGDADTDAATCSECSPGQTAACVASGKGAACLPSHMCGCTKDSDCGGVSSGRVCNPQTNACQAGCRGTGGNHCPSGDTCSSTDGGVGTCSGDAGISEPDAGDPADAGATDDASTEADAAEATGSTGEPADDGSGHETPSGNSNGTGSSTSSGANADGTGDGGATDTGGGKKGGCSATGGGARGDLGAWGALLGLALLGRRRRARI